jgi:hypothetical protein
MVMIGPKLLDKLGKEADESRMLVDVCCRRIVRPDFDAGYIPGRPSQEDLVKGYDPSSFARRLLTDTEWEDILQRVHTWQDEIDASCVSQGARSVATFNKIMGKISRFPTVEKVRALVGEEAAEQYQEALEEMEKDPTSFATFPSERSSGGWNKQSAERAVALVTDVLVPHVHDPEAMIAAYGRFMDEYRSQQRERKLTHNASKEQRRAAARAMGIWLPMQSDIPRWESDPRTAERAPEFEMMVIKVDDKMRILRSVLQYIPRRRFSNHTIDDLDRNMKRLRNYIRDESNRFYRKGTS